MPLLNMHLHVRIELIWSVTSVLPLFREEESLDNIKQYYVECMSEESKYQAISNIYGVITIGQAIIFCHVSQLVGR